MNQPELIIQHKAVGHFKAKVLAMDMLKFKIELLEEVSYKRPKKGKTNKSEIVTTYSGEVFEINRILCYNEAEIIYSMIKNKPIPVPGYVSKT